MKRIFLIVLDSFGVGAMPDSESFGDVGVNTLAACATSKELHIPNMIAAGLGNIDGVACLPKSEAPIGAVARMQEASMGKDTTIGHWEIAGIVSPDPLPTYPNGFPEDVLKAFEEAGFYLSGAVLVKSREDTHLVLRIGEILALFEHRSHHLGG